MILYKKFDPKTVLLMLAHVIGESLPEEIKNSDAEINLTFEDDHSVEVYLIKPNENQS